MKHRIDPKIDCVFKALLGAEENRNLLVHFLNAILALELKAPLADVEILNPYNEREFAHDKLSIVDVKARDFEGRLFQIEIQLVQYGQLVSRILYSWADIYSQQLQSGESYDKLKPTYSIWLLDDRLIASDQDYVRTYKMRDARGQTLLDHGGIWLFEIKKFHAQNIDSEEQRWLRFLKEGHQLDDLSLPDWMFTKEMEQAMSTLRKFSDKERDYHEYQARQNYLRQQQAIQQELESALTRTDEAHMETERALLETRNAIEEKKKAMEEKERAIEESNRAIEETERAIEETERAIKEKESALEEKRRANEDKQRAVQEKQRALVEKQNAVQEKQRALEEKQNAVQEKQRAMEEREEALEEKQDALTEIARLKALLEQRGQIT